MRARSEVHTELEYLTKVRRYSEAELPTAYGPARVFIYRDGETDSAARPVEHAALVFGHPEQTPDNVLVRVHSECLTSEIFGSLKCDCREQLTSALQAVSKKGTGVVIYLRQEGRGIGLGNKIRAYALQAEGADTVEANHELGFAADQRSYEVAAAILRDLGVRGATLMTNNPRKIQGLEAAGIKVRARHSIRIPANVHSADYLAVKGAKMGHLFDPDTDNER